MTLTKADLTNRLVEGIDLPTRESRELVDALFSEIAMMLSQGDEVKLVGFGVFNVRDKVARPGRNLATGESVKVTASRVVTFHGSSKLKDHVENASIVAKPKRKSA